ncbi:MULTISPECIES: hypothetical protein [unclassified Mesorhizobium]|uniref:hypothetical protein n=1 Tax=unclassified Mesorhizobium TaxID=325217 RepID=UPI000FCA8258|nr:MULTISPECIES: hypothetical protein [unclassified Mesorhizobium]RUW52123.1 hypothetical protein EOA36_13085 [Mesorhizobium sp. M8A.F.Ca.ET.021.01.1.1]TGP90246.1 hypothetical protein EN861_24815 [Mesorhizobium sp. M8A.F.Ca.ET.218.01.1.1]TGT16737.1 hypothetical protein EN856_24350 [Mesorhizobium sp. M8A.F.Ca.ET.213.01.1.1]TIS84854.1 MAG: hypothetical protein E5W88_27450 [Mesorhizobium sp.]
MQKSTKAIRVAAPLLAILGMVAPFILPMTHISSAQAQEEYLPTQKDFVGKWQLSGATTRPPRDMKDAPTPEQEAAANEFQQTVTAFYDAFDYLEITADGRYNFHQPGDPTSGSCVWCGTWSFSKSSLWLELDTAPRLDIYAKGGDIQMTYTAEPDEKSKYAWLVFGWTKVD